MSKCDVAAIIWPAFTGAEPRTKIFWEERYGEWQTVKKRCEGQPLWGYINEADPFVMEMQIEAAVSHGVNVFIYDWYWYDNRPFLENCLNDGFLKARNNDKMKFYLMWANHDASALWDMRNSDDFDTVIWNGFQNRAEFERIAERIIEKYFKLPNYYQIDGKPVFMIYEARNLLKGLGGYYETKDALKWFDDKAKEAGFKGVHIQHCRMEFDQLDKYIAETGKDMTEEEALKDLGYSSMSHYQFCNMFSMKDQTYENGIGLMKEAWEKFEKTPLTYYPHVSLGWNRNPRLQFHDPYILKNNTPENVEKAFRCAKEWVEAHPEEAPLIVVNSWNEWTEGSYFEPDTVNGYGFLEAAKKVFVEE
ncbi:MAG: glycoside hydrolase family 99-like domain-containing protein [Clostridiales bacterium]|nr:glycoside hydrolase family 99-like domain-containing protein [Clostridiales bacterium]